MKLTPNPYIMADKDYHAMLNDPLASFIRHPSLRLLMEENISSRTSVKTYDTKVNGNIRPETNNPKIYSKEKHSENNQQLNFKITAESLERHYFNNIIGKIQPKMFQWHDKFKTRKPKYFIRVHTGYDWNRYNQTHYDSESPPPKVVIGYKFNIFYPEMNENKQVPRYSIHRDFENKFESTCFISFHSGSPYEDISFRIVNKEW